MKIQTLQKQLNYLIDTKDNSYYKVIKSIQTTEFSEINLVQNDEENLFACKVISKENLQIKKYYEMFSQEIQIIQSLNNRNIMAAYKVIKDIDNYYILSSYCSNGTLIDLVQNREHLAEEEIQFIIYELMNALLYLKQQKIIHRDLKPQNILIDHILPDDKELYDQLRIKIIDFGLSHKFNGDDEKQFNFCGSPIIIAPEMLISHVVKRLLQNKPTNEEIDAECKELIKQIVDRQINIRQNYKKYDPLESGYEYEVDMWGLGIVMYYLMYRKFPFTAQTISLLYQKQIRGDFIINTSKNPLLSQTCISFMENLLSPNRNDRMSITEAFESDWISHGAMVKLTFLPSQSIHKQFSLSKYSEENMEVYNFKETIEERIIMQQQGLIQKPINLPTIDISDALKGLGLLKIQMRPPRPITTKIPFDIQISINSWLVKNYAQVLYNGLLHDLPNPVKWPPIIHIDNFFNKLMFDEFIGNLSKKTLKCIKNYQIWRYGITRNACYEEELSGLPNIVHAGGKVVAATHSQKYGYFYILNDGTCCGKFYDDSIIILSPNELLIDVIDYPQALFLKQMPEKYWNKKQTFRVKYKFYEQFFQKNKLVLLQWFKQELKNQLKQDQLDIESSQLVKRDTMILSPSKCEDLQTSSDSPSFNSTRTGSSIEQHQLQTVKLPIEPTTTLDAFLYEFLDLLYDDQFRIFHPNLSADDLQKFINQRRRQIQKGKTSDGIHYQQNNNFAYILHLNNPKILSIILQDIIAALIENAQADYGANAIISYIAASVDLNFICLNFLRNGQLAVEKQVITDDIVLFRVNNGGFQVNWKNQQKLIINQEMIRFENEEHEILEYPLVYLQDQDFKCTFLKQMIAEIKEQNKIYQI
ncbi:Kinase, PLK [Spironucleus salmonicida]|uniref:Kinase, PLK n=1 Tax=Spironucleus salmonicida TaxID=348837 RepID=V6M240_9EUKA|nr:Kinase, PLK [Spironucleus salmonicida]|eukprot:EST47274.1 Kinase, PLK [Spironucleus salmonicida]